MGLVVAVSGTRDRRELAIRLFFLYLAYNLFEMALKRATHFTFYIYPIRGFLLLLVLHSWWKARRQGAQNPAKPPLQAILKVYLFLAALQVFNPYLMNPIVGAMAWYNDFIQVLLYFVAFDLMSEWPLVRRFFWLTVWLGILSAIACFIEQAVGPEELMKSYPTFVQLSHYDETGRTFFRPMSLSIFMEVFAIAMMIPLLMISTGFHRKLLLLGFIFACSTANILHGVRIAWVTAAFFAAGLTLLNWRRSVLQAVILLVCLTAGFKVAMSLTEGSILLRVDTMETPMQTYAETRLEGLLALVNLIARYPFGQGVGWGSPGLRFVEFNSTHTVLYGFHNYLVDLAAQVSLLGPLLLLGFCYGVLRRGLRAYRGLRDKEARAYVACMLALFGAITVSFFGGGALGSYPANEYFWFMAGILIRVASNHYPAHREAVGFSPYRRLQAFPAPR